MRPVRRGRRAAGHRRGEDPVLGGLGAREDRRDRAVGEDQRAVGDVGQLGEVGRVEEDRVAVRRELTHHREDLGLGPDIDAAGRVVEEQDPSAGLEQLGQDDLLLIAARQRPGQLFGRVGFDLRPLDPPLDHGGLGARVDDPEPGHLAQRGQDEVLADGLRQQQALLPTVLGQEDHPDAGRHRMARTPDPHRSPSDGDLSLGTDRTEQAELFLALFGALGAQGQVTVRGRPVRIRSPRHAMSAGIGMVLLPEDRRQQGLLLTKTVRENLVLSALGRVARFGIIDPRAEATMVERGIQRTQIKAETSEQLAGTLSGGNQQKVVLAKLLETGARILLFYDPTRGVDVGTKAEMFAMMRELAANGYAILFYSTDLAELAHVADRTLVLSYGTISTVLAEAETTEDRILAATMAGGAAAHAGPAA